MADDSEFSVERRIARGVSIVAVDGEVDLQSAVAIRAELRAAAQEATEVVLDLRAVTFIDSSGIRLLVEVQRAADRDGFRFAVVRGSDEVQRLFELVGIADRLTLVDTPQEARRDGPPAA